MGIVYVLSNPAFGNYVKIGSANNFKQLKKQLHSTSVPLPFCCEYAIKVGDDLAVKNLVHKLFAEVRVSKKREFFKIDAQSISNELELFNGHEVTLEFDDYLNNNLGTKIGDRIQPKPSSKFSDARVYEGDILTFSKDKSITATAVAGNKIKFEGDFVSLSKAALTILHRKGIMWKRANGWTLWTKDGETLVERVKCFKVSVDQD